MAILGVRDLENQPLPNDTLRKIYWDNAAALFGAQLSSLASI